MINKKSLFLIALIAIQLANQLVCAQSEPDENTKRASLLSFFQSAKSTADPVPTLNLTDFSALPALFTEDPKYQNNNDLLQILNLFTTPKTVDAIINELWHNNPSVETCVGCNVLIKHMIAAYKGNEDGFRRFFFTVCELLKLNGKGGQPVYVKVAGQDSGRCTPK